MTTNNQKCYVGIDVSSTKLDVFISTKLKVMQFHNDKNGIDKLIKKLSLFHNVFVTLEATGGYEQDVAQALAKADFHVAMVNPRQVRDFAKAIGKLAKTDAIDANVIALFAEKTHPKANVTYNPEQIEIAHNNTRRRQIIDMINKEKNRRLQAKSQDVKDSINSIIDALEKALKQINQVQKTNIENNSQFNQKHSLLTGIKGVGNIVATSIISELPELGTLSNKQISALAGLAPFNRDSGKFKGRRTIWGGRAPIRTILYMSTLVAIRHNQQIKQFYERLCDAGKAKKVAIVACMRKLLTIMNAMIKNNEHWIEKKPVHA